MGSKNNRRVTILELESGRELTLVFIELIFLTFEKIMENRGWLVQQIAAKSLLVQPHASAMGSWRVEPWWLLASPRTWALSHKGLPSYCCCIVSILLLPETSPGTSTSHSLEETDQLPGRKLIILDSFQKDQELNLSKTHAKANLLFLLMVPR